MKRILVASDLSARSDRAVRRAVRLAGQTGAALNLVHVVDDELPDEIAQSAMAAAGDMLSAMVSRLDVPAGVDVAVKVVAGQAHLSIVDEAAASDADLIVLGIHRNESSRLPVIGSTMGRVIRESSVPLLVAMRPAGDPYRKAVVGVDLSVFSEAAIAAAKFLVPDGEIELVYAYHVPFSGFLSHSVSADDLRREYQKDLAELIGRQAKPIHRIAKSPCRGDSRIRAEPIEGEVRAVLRNRVDEIDAELLVLGSNGRSDLTRIWLGSVAEHFLVHPPCDVLVVKA